MFVGNKERFFNTSNVPSFQAAIGNAAVIHVACNASPLHSVGEVAASHAHHHFVLRRWLRACNGASVRKKWDVLVEVPFCFHTFPVDVGASDSKFPFQIRLCGGRNSSISAISTSGGIMPAVAFEAVLGHCAIRACCRVACRFACAKVVGVVCEFRGRRAKRTFHCSRGRRNNCDLVLLRKELLTLFVWCGCAIRVSVRGVWGYSENVRVRLRRRCRFVNVSRLLSK